METPPLLTQIVLSPKVREILDEQLQNIFAVYGLLITLEKAINNYRPDEDGHNSFLAFADCARAGKIVLDGVTDVLDKLKEQLPKWTN